MFSHIHRLGPFLGVQNQYFLFIFIFIFFFGGGGGGLGGGSE